MFELFHLFVAFVRRLVFLTFCTPFIYLFVNLTLVGFTLVPIHVNHLGRVFFVFIYKYFYFILPSLFICPFYKSFSILKRCIFVGAVFNVRIYCLIKMFLSFSGLLALVCIAKDLHDISTRYISDHISHFCVISLRLPHLCLYSFHRCISLFLS